MEVEIYITSQSYGGVSNYTVKGNLLPSDNGFSLAYALDGDECELVCDGEGISQSRKGELTYSVKFIPYTKCKFEFSEGGFNFCREVDVFKAYAFLNEDGCNIRILYADGQNSSKDDVTELFISAVYKK